MRISAIEANGNVLGKLGEKGRAGLSEAEAFSGLQVERHATTIRRYAKICAGQWVQRPV
jgi:hypothetical protein